MQARIPTLPTPLAAAPRSVAIHASLFRALHGVEPDGVGWWTFDFYATGRCVERNWRYGGQYRFAVEAARHHARSIGAGVIELLP